MPDQYNSNIVRGAVTIESRGTDMHPLEYRTSLYEQIPASKAPFTATLMQMGVRPTPSRIFKWAGLAFCDQLGAVADVFTDAAGTEYAAGQAAGTNVVIKMSEANVSKIQNNDVLTITNDSYQSVTVSVHAVNVMGSNSNVGAKLMVSDETNAVLAGTGLYFSIDSMAMEVMSQLPDPIYEEGEWIENCTQIMMEATAFSGSELAEKERIEPGIATRAPARAFMRLRNKMEKAFLFSPYSITQKGPNGRQKFMTRGLVPAIQQYEPDNVFCYPTDTDYRGQKFRKGGIRWLQRIAEQLARYSEAPQKKCYLGGLAWLAINEAIEEMGTYRLEPMTDEYGIRIQRLHGLATTLDFVLHPIFNIHPHRRRSMLITEPELVAYRPVEGRDVQFIAEADKNKDGWTWVDGVKSGWFVDAGLEFDNLSAMAWCQGIGANNELAAA